MTSPITFPTISPPQLAPEQRPFEGLAQLLLAMQQHRAQIDIARQNLALEKQRTEASVKASGDVSAANKQELKDKVKAAEEHDLKLQALAIANKRVSLLVLPKPDGSGPTGADLNALKADALKTEDPKLKPFMLDAIDEAFQHAQTSMHAIATRHIADVQANIEEKTQAAQIAAKNLAPDVARAQLHEAQVNTQARELELQGFDASRVSAADALWRASLKPWRQIRKQLGLPRIKGGLSDDAVFSPAGKATDTSAQRSALSEALNAANVTLNNLGPKGLKPIAFGLLVNNPTGIISGTIDAAANRALSVEQQHLLAGYGGFIGVLQAALPRGATSDKDIAGMKQAFTPLDGQSEGVIKQKILLRNAFVASFAKAAPGDHTAALDNMLKLARSMGVKDPALLAPFIALRPKLKEADANIGVDSTDAIINDVVKSKRTGGVSRSW